MQALGEIITSKITTSKIIANRSNIHQIPTDSQELSEKTQEQEKLSDYGPIRNAQLWLEKMIEVGNRVPVENYSVDDKSRCPFPVGGCEECKNGRRSVYGYGDAVRRVYDVSKCYDDYVYRMLIGKSGVKGVGASQTFDNFRTDKFNKNLYDALQKWDYKTGKGIYIAALKDPNNPQGNGTGKTYGLNALAHKLCHNKVACLLATTTEFFMEIKATYGEYAAENEMRILDRYKNIPVLLWDDVGKENISKNSDWAPEKMFHVIDERVKRRKPIVISSNFSIEELEGRFGADNYGPAIVSRLFELCGDNYYFLGGADRRIGR